MRRCSRIVPAFTIADPPVERAGDRVVLDHDSRHRRRIVLRSVSGEDFLLDLMQATTLRHGDLLVLDDGRTIAVEAAPERLGEIEAGGAGALMRIAWHLGNRHLPTQLMGDRIRIRHDHVIVDMVHGLGGRTREVREAFDPEGGAYGFGATMGHHHDHGHDHHHGHNHDHGHAADHHHGHGHGHRQRRGHSHE